MNPVRLEVVTFNQVSPATFAHLLHSLQPFAGGRVLALLEGGYFLPSLAGGFEDIELLPAPPPPSCKSSATTTLYGAN